jgi:transposase
MLSLSSSHSYYLYAAAVDMRKSFDGLCGLIRSQTEKNPASGEVFVFLNRSRNLLKLLHWEHGGFVLYYKRLEQGTFTPPLVSGDSGRIRWPELVLMIEGIQVEKSTQKLRYGQ